MAMGSPASAASRRAETRLSLDSSLALSSMIASSLAASAADCANAGTVPAHPAPATIIAAKAKSRLILRGIEHLLAHAPGGRGHSQDTPHDGRAGGSSRNPVGRVLLSLSGMCRKSRSIAGFCVEIREQSGPSRGAGEAQSTQRLSQKAQELILALHWDIFVF